MIYIHPYILFFFQTKVYEFFRYLGYMVRVFINQNTQSTISATGDVFLFMNAAVNPVIYGLTNPKYREAFKNLLTPIGLVKSRKGMKSSNSDNATNITKTNTHL